MNIQELKNHVGNKVVFASLLTETEPKMNKGGRGGVAANPFYGRVTKSTRQTVQLNRNYENAVINRAEKVGGNADNFQADGMTGKQWMPGFEHLIAKSEKNPEQLYLRTYVGEGNNNRPHSIYMVDGREATDEELAIIRQYLPKQSESAKQEACGLLADEGEQIIPRDYKLEGIRELKIGEFKFSS